MTSVPTLTTSVDKLPDVGTISAGQSENILFTLVMQNIFMYYTPPFYPVDLQYSSYKHVLSSRLENSVDPDQMASSVAIESGYTVFSKMDKFEFSRARVNT